MALADVLVPLVTAAVAVASKAFADVLLPLLRREAEKRGLIQPRPKPAEPAPFGERLETLFSELRTATERVDRIMREMAEVSHERRNALERVEQQLTRKTAAEAELKQRIEALRAVTPEAARVFAREAEKLGRSSEDRAKRRDYGLFVGGVVAGGVISIIIELFFK